MKLLLPLLLIIIGVAGGVGAGLALKPTSEGDSTEAATSPEADVGSQATEPSDVESEADDKSALVKMNNQFVVPVVDESRVKSIVVLSLSLKAGELDSELVYNREPLLRDAFLQALFDHANIGGFDGVYTASSKMEPLRESLLEVAKEITGDAVSQILITEYIRQDL